MLACKVYMIAVLISVLLHVRVCVCGPPTSMLLSEHTETGNLNPHI